MRGRALAHWFVRPCVENVCAQLGDNGSCRCVCFTLALSLSLSLFRSHRARSLAGVDLLILLRTCVCLCVGYLCVGFENKTPSALRLSATLMGAEVPKSHRISVPVSAPMVVVVVGDQRLQIERGCEWINGLLIASRVAGEESGASTQYLLNPQRQSPESFDLYLETKE